MKRLNMNKTMISKVALLTCLFLILATQVFAANHYIRAGASGSGNGNDWTNAYTALPATLTRGDIYYIADGTYGNYTFDDAHSGTTLITIKKATITDHGTDAGWSSTYGDGQAYLGQLIFVRGYYVVDGQTRNSDWEDGYGFVIDRSVTDDHAVEFAGGWYYSGGTPTNITLKYLYLKGKYQGANHLDLVYCIGADHINMQYMKIYYPSRCPILTRDSSYMLLEYTVLGGDTYTSLAHAEGWSDSNSNYITIRYNKFRDAWGTGVIVVLGGNTASNSWIIYGNILYATMSGINTANGAIAVILNNNPSNWKVYNNTIYNLQGNEQGVDLNFDGGGTMTNCTVYNNLWYNNPNAVNKANTIGYNYYSSTTHSGTGETNIQNASGNPFVSTSTGDFRLIAATNAGITLNNETVNGILQTYNTDMLGNVRGADGTWDRGALEFQSGSSPKSPNPPSNLR